MMSLTKIVTIQYQFKRHQVLEQNIFCQTEIWPWWCLNTFPWMRPPVVLLLVGLVTVELLLLFGLTAGQNLRSRHPCLTRDLDELQQSRGRTLVVRVLDLSLKCVPKISRLTLGTCQPGKFPQQELSDLCRTFRVALDPGDQVMIVIQILDELGTSVRELSRSDNRASSSQSRLRTFDLIWRMAHWNRTHMYSESRTSAT